MSTAATLTVIETPAFLKRPDVFESANESGLFNVKVCRNCQSSILDCICDTPAEDLVPIYRNGQGTNQRFAYYLREKHTAHTAERSAYQVAIDAGKVDGFVYPDLARPAAEMRSRMKLWLRPDKHEILRALQLIQAPDSIVELRILNTPQGTWSGYYNDLHILAQDASELGELKTTPNVYVTLQSLKSNLGSSFNTTVAYSKTTTSDSDVIAYRWLPIDADPDRPSKVSSTDAEKQLTWNVVQSVRAFLTTQGIETVLADSGNGYHLLIRVDLPVAKAQLVKDLVNAFSHKFATCKEPGTGGVISDEKIFNPARIWKLYGTVARKGPNTPDRPWRMSRLLDVPADIENRPVTEEKLLELLVSMGGSITSLEAVPESPSPSAPGRVTADMILNEAARLGISLRDAGECSIGQDKGHKWQMDCVFNPMHECPDAFLFLSNGYMLFSCSHNSCKKHGTKDFCEKIHGFDFVKPIRVTLGGKDLTSVPETTREATTNSPSIPARRITMTRGDQVKPTRIKWLWKDRIVKNNISVFSGEPDRGKGLIYIDAAARITTGIDFFDSPNDLGGPRDVVILASEDDLENTIVPRLIVAGADMKRIHFCTITENIKGTDEEGLVCLDRDLDAVEETLKSYPDIVFAVLDPIIAFVGDLDSNKDKDMRPLYSRLKAIAKRREIAFLTINHWNKNAQATGINRTGGAKTLVSAPRASWMFQLDPDDPTLHLMLKGKGNLSKSNLKGLSYRTVGVLYDFQDGEPKQEVAKVEWVGESDKQSEDLLVQAIDPTDRGSSKAEKIIVDMCAEKPCRATEIYDAGMLEHLNDKVMRRAQKKLNYSTLKFYDGGSWEGHWYWGKTKEELLALKEGFARNLMRPDVKLGGKPLSDSASLPF